MARLLLALLVLAAAPLALAHDPAGTPKPFCEAPADRSTHDYGPSATHLVSFLPRDGNLDDCHDDGTYADFDGHLDFALGGGVFLACDVACGALGQGIGATACWGAAPDHPAQPFASVHDLALGAGVHFMVGVDYVSADPTVDTCGDGEVDLAQACVGSCAVALPPGLDGGYPVFVEGIAGHASMT